MYSVRQVVYDPLCEVKCQHEPCECEFHVGEEVYWESCGTRKEGYIIAVVLPGSYPPTLEEFKYYSFRANGYGAIRTKISYLVAIPPKNEKCCTKLYYPRAKWLQKI